MGLMDHKKSFEFHVAASPVDCRTAFQRGMSSSSSWSPTGSSWSFSHRGDTTVAVYEGRSKLMQGLGGMIGGRAGQVSRDEADNAIGSEVEFTIVGTDEQGRTVCRMHLAQHGVRIGFTSDARFIRPAMQKVSKALRELDPGLVEDKI